MKTKLLGLVLVLGLVVIATIAHGLFSAIPSVDTPQDYVVSVPITPDTQEVIDTSVQKKLIRNMDINFNRAVYLNSSVNEYSVASVVSGIRALDQGHGPIWLLINSPGGSVFDGELVLSTIESTKNPVYTVCTHLCASMSAIIFSYGSKRYMFDRSTLMFHDASGGVNGPVLHMQRMLTFIQRSMEKMNRQIAKRAGMSYEDFMKLQVKDLWIDAEDAKNLNLADDLIAVKTDLNFRPSVVSESENKKDKNIITPKLPKFEL